MPRLGSGIPLVGRGVEMDRLRAAVRRAAGGSSGAVLIAGEAGVGKTRLVEELAAYAREAGAVVLSGRCVDVGEAGLPYLPFVEALAQARDLGGEGRPARPGLSMLLPGPVVAQTESAAAEPQRFAPNFVSVSGMAPRREQDIGQLQLFDAVHAQLAELAAERSVVLVVEDLHWADGSTRGLLSFLLSRSSTRGLLVVGTYRTDDLHRRHPLRPLLAELARLPSVERLELAPFDAADAHAFVAALAEGRVDEVTLRRVAGQSEGNAFFAEELLAAFTDEGGDGESRAGTTRGIPSSLMDVLLTRVEGLGEPAQRVIRVASVAGRRVRHSTLREVCDLDDDRLEEALREAVQHHVLVVGGDGGGGGGGNGGGGTGGDLGDREMYAFRHALLREAVYGDLLPGERVRLHAAYARYLTERQETQRGASAALAHHSLESNALPAALAASVRAAEEATGLGAPAESLRLLEQALRLWSAVEPDRRPPGTDELTLLRRASWAAGTSGEPERAVAFARSAVQLADERDDPEVAAEARRRLAQALLAIEGTEEEARTVIACAWEGVAGLPPSRVRAWVLAVQARILRFDQCAFAREQAELAVRDARAVGATGAAADALATLAILTELERGPGEGGPDEGGPEGRGPDVGGPGDGGPDDGEPRESGPDRSRALLMEALEGAAEAGAIAVELRTRYYLGLHHYERGRLKEADEAIETGVGRACATGLTWSDFGLELRVLQVLVRFASGDWDGGEAAAEQPRGRVSGTVSARLAAVGLHIAVAGGRFGDAEQLITDLRTEWYRDLQIPLMAGSVGAELACWRGQPELAVARVRETLDWARKVGGPWLMAGIRLGAVGTSAYADLAANAMARDDTTAAERAVAEGERFAEHARRTAEHGTPRTGVLGPEGRAWLARAEAELTRLRGASAPESWEAAVEAFGYGAVYEQALCRWRLGEALLGADRRDEAAGALRDADAVAARLGAVPLREAVAQLARRARIPLTSADGRPVPESGEAAAVALTPRELSVLRVVALGRTNRQVGEELFISEKTVSAHLSHIMAKLGASRRGEAVAIAYERGLLD
ncbi:AAA family ATPase [Streptomyces sp. NPDC047108]|uniref:helix-turn-helix transcriptional regulator n=1 Tax=Streptomyces sp. NPDC047108 TaxID=3155025 RepID=UPI003402E4CC